MAVHCATNADYLKRTSGFLNPASNSTLCFWVKFPTVSVSPAYQTGYVLLDAIGTYTEYVAVRGNSASLRLNGNMTPTTTTAPTAGVWYHIAWVQVGTTQVFYVNGTSVGSHTYNRAAVAITLEQLCSDTLDAGNVTVAYVREWQEAFSGTQVQAEMVSTTAVHLANLFMDCPMRSDAVDTSGNGHSWTSVGAPVFDGLNDPLAANGAITSATTVGTLPQSLTISSGSVGQFWYAYTATTDQVMIGVFAISALVDNVTVAVFLGPTNAPTEWLIFNGAIAGANRALQIPVTAGVTYYLKVMSQFAITADLIVSIVAGPTQVVPIGSIFTNDDEDGFPTAIVSAVDGADYQVLQFVDIAVTVSEQGGDVLENGRCLLLNDEGDDTRLYSGQLELLVTIPSSTIPQLSNGIIRTCVGAQVFYLGNAFEAANASHAVIHRIDAEGVPTDHWNLPAAGISGMAAKNDESVIYVTGTSSGSNMAIRQWIPASSTFGADLVAAVASYNTHDLLVLGDNTIVAQYHQAIGTLQFVRLYDAAGATLNTYSLPAGNTESSLFHALDDPTSFWARTHNGTTGLCTYTQFRTSDGTVLASIDHVSYEAGQYQPSVTLTPLARFGVSESCPSFILREALTPPIPEAEPVEYLIRRERWFPHIGQEQLRQFFSKLQIDLYAGNGISTGQGSDPLLEIDWSDDGGHTWSDIHFVQTGAIGAFRTRAILRRMGNSRDRVFRIACSDPVQWSVVNGYLDATLGTS